MTAVAFLLAVALLGPRPLPPSFVPLEVASFPRPAAEACRDNIRIVRVRPPSGIARALAAARPGTTVQAGPGVYTESRGEPTAVDWRAPNVCLRGTRVILQAAPGQKYGLAISASDAVVEGLTLRGFSSSIGLAGALLRRITIERVRVERPRGDFRDGIAAYTGTVDGLLLLDVSVSGTDLGVSCNEGPCAHWWLEGVRVQGRRASDSSGADAFAIERGRQVAVVDSTFAGAAADGIDVKGGDVVVLGSRVLDVGRNAIKLWRGGDVIDTVVDGSGADASLVGDAAARYRYLHVLVRRHDPGGSGYVGAWGYDRRAAGLRLEIVNSIFADNATGGFFAPAGARVSIRRTIFDDPGAKLLDLSDGRTWRASEAGALGRGNRAADPMLGRGWSTLPGSPARDRAEPVPGLTRDLYGRPRSRGAGPDIGPVESG